MIKPKNSKTLLVIIAALLALNIAGVILFFAKTPSGKRMSYTEQRKNAMQKYLRSQAGYAACVRSIEKRKRTAYQISCSRPV
jgi:hypothetical protein